MSEKLKEILIKEFTRLLIKTDFYEKSKGVEVYVSKKRIYKDIIRMLKEML